MRQYFHLRNGVLLVCTLLAGLIFSTPSPGNPDSVSESVIMEPPPLELLADRLNRKEAELNTTQQRALEHRDRETAHRLQEVRSEVAELRHQFDRFAINIDPPHPEASDAPFDWQEELGKLLKPIMAEIELATRQSRRATELREEMAAFTRQRDLATLAVTRLARLDTTSASEEIRTALQQRAAEWNRILQETSAHLAAVEHAYEQEGFERHSPFDAAIAYGRTFLQTRGVNLLLGFLAFIGVFSVIRLLAWFFGRMQKQSPEKSIGGRMILLAIQIASVLGGIVAALIVFAITTDWFLLAITFIFLVGIAWASMSALPQYLETLRLMLNIGAVRDGERLVLDGIAWRVDRLGLRARLVNPLLDGGELNLPIKLLLGHYSRPAAADEEWFACRRGDWVQLADGTTGKTVCQTPGIVQLETLGGSTRTYQTPAFLALNPHNMAFRFRLEATFSIDYRHQAICTTQIPQLMQERLRQEFPRLLDPAAILEITVLFSSAGTSSLGYLVLIDLAGSAAHYHQVAPCWIQSILVDLCNEQGWRIPFTQITVHQADGKMSGGTVDNSSLT